MEGEEVIVFSALTLMTFSIGRGIRSVNLLKMAIKDPGLPSQSETISRMTLIYLAMVFVSTVCDAQDVMVVGEPTLMGGEFGDKDERLIARLENTQYDPNEQQEETAEQSADHCARQVPGTTAPPMTTTTSFGAPSLVTVAQSRARPCPPGSPTALHSSWGMDKITVPPPQQQSSSTIPNDKLSSEFE